MGQGVKLTLLILATEALFGSSPQAEANICDAILQQGIYDQRRVASAESRVAIARSVYCNESLSLDERERAAQGSGAWAGGLGGTASVSASDQAKKLDWREVCDAKNDYQWSDGTLSELTTNVNEAVVSAWSSCWERAGDGFVHRVVPFDDVTFYYEVIYNSNGLPYAVPLSNLEFTPPISDELVCTGLEQVFVRTKVPTDASNPNPPLSNSAPRITCTRKDPSKMVVINASADTGGKRLFPIKLAGRPSSANELKEALDAVLPCSDNGKIATLTWYYEAHQKTPFPVIITPTGNAKEPFRITKFFASAEYLDNNGPLNLFGWNLERYGITASGSLRLFTTQYNDPSLNPDKIRYLDMKLRRRECTRNEWARLWQPTQSEAPAPAAAP